MRLEPGAELEALTSPPVTRMSIAYMAVAMRDPNPVHVEDSVAEATGLPQVVAHGTFPLGYAGALLTRNLGFDAVKRLSVDIVAPIFPGDELRAQARVTATDDGEGEADLELTVHNGEGTLVARGTATVSAP